MTFYLTGIALHTIQDYYAHSYDNMTLAEYKKNWRKYMDKEGSEKANTFHLDWAYEYREMYKSKSKRVKKRYARKGK